MDVHTGPANASSAQRPSARRRVAAAVALITLVAAAVVVAWRLVQHPVQLPLALLLIILAVIAAWTAVVHHGIRRVLAAIAAVVTLAATVALPDVRSFALLAVVIGLIAISTAAVKVAVARDLAPATATRSAGPANHGVLLMNPWSGGRKVERFGLEEKARELGITPVVLQRGDDLRVLAEHAVAEGADVIGMAGGDGSQALVADVARRHHIPFICVPAGTRNHFALDLGLDRADVTAALGAFGDALERRVDLAMLGDRVFVNNASLGVYAAIVHSAGYRDAKLATAQELLPDLLGPDVRGFDLRFTRPDGASVRSADIVLVSNGVYRLDSLKGFGTRSRLDAGVLGVATLTVNRARDLPALIVAEAGGHLDRFPGYQEWTTREFEVDSGQPLVDVGVDGEALRLPPPLRFRSLPGALRVRTPIDAPNTAPAAVTPVGIRQVVTASFRVLAGHPAR
ncbi:diacylglycerol kinase family enzyme [Kibdelosporangium banguiense]|uniref:Diacylglycerol kinase family enzyme n=1 Tax=Kibdelosporangium banguiense TaxID=1365924 RepID=A0ABS4TWE1_9PSEU|nr:diacylglycerol kinase family protein [Kibdelosporangium banguiense]MBP2328699.1 diacylglycerol kinase family enzyme [Kibdelosporangium banguiense]